MVKVYSINECPRCDKVKKYLKSRNVEFEEHNIETNEEDHEACYKLSGDTMVPITTTDNQTYVLIIRHGNRHHRKIGRAHV